MMNKKFIELLKLNVLKPLPGIDVQMKMAPPVRTRNATVPANAKKGGVCVLLFEENKEWKILLMKRTDDGGTHSGQISFPGGSYDQDDYCITYTALRELNEEMGVDLQNLEILGSLTELYIPPSNFLIYPTVVICKNEICLNPNEKEVEAVLKIPIQVFMDKNNIIEKTVNRSDNNTISMKAPVYKIDEENFIWGATAMVLAELVEIVR